MQMMNRRILISLLTELADKLRVKNPSTKLTIFEQTETMSGKDVLRSLTICELTKLGMASKNFSCVSSPPRGSFVRRERILYISLGSPISFVAFMQMTTRRILISSLTELEDRLRTKNPSNKSMIFERTLSRRGFSRFFTI